MALTYEAKFNIADIFRRNKILRPRERVYSQESHLCMRLTNQDQIIFRMSPMPPGISFDRGIRIQNGPPVVGIISVESPHTNTIKLLKRGDAVKYQLAVDTSVNASLVPIFDADQQSTLNEIIYNQNLTALNRFITPRFLEKITIGSAPK